MSFIIVDKQPGGGSGEISIGQAGKATEIYTVVASDIDHSTEDLRAAGLFPEPYTTFHAMNPRLRLQPLQIEQDDEAPDLFTVTATWSSEKMDPKDKEESESNPLNRRARITVKTSHLREVKHLDVRGIAKTNKVGDLFDPPVESNASFLVINIRKNVTFFEDWVFDYSDAVNSLPFTIRGRTINKGCAWIASIELGEENTDGPVAYCEARIEIQVKKKRDPTPREAAIMAGNPTVDLVPDPWWSEVLHEGLFEKKGGKKVRIKVKDEDGNSVNAPCPVPLDDFGAALVNPTLDDLRYLVFQDHFELDFNQISNLWTDA